MQQFDDRQLGVISDRIKQRFFPELQRVIDITAMVDQHHAWITENRNSIIQTINEIDTLKTSNTEIKNSLNMAIVNIGNVNIPNSIFGNLGERATFNAGYQDSDVTTMGEKRKFHFADVPINSIIQSEGFGQFTSQLISSIPIGEPITPSPGPIIIPGDGFGAIPMSKGGKAKKLQVIDPGRFNINPRFNYAGSIPVEGEVETFKYTLYELMNTRWGLSKQNSWRFFGATARRMDDVNNRIKVFAPIEGVVKDIGDKWGSFSEMHKYLSDLGLTPTKFASDVWNVSGEFGNRIKQLLPEIDLKMVGSDLGTAKIPINLDRLWDGPLISPSGTSNTPLKDRVTASITNYHNTGALRTELGSKPTGTFAGWKVWDQISSNFTQIGLNRDALNNMNTGILADRTRLGNLESIIGTRPSGILGSIWDNIAALKKKIADMGILKTDLLGIRTKITNLTTTVTGTPATSLLEKLRSVNGWFRNIMLSEEVVTYNMDVSQWFGFAERTATFKKTYPNTLSMIVSVSSDFKEWIENEADKEAFGGGFNRKTQLRGVRLDFMTKLVTDRIKGKFTDLFTLVQKPLETQIIPQTIGIGSTLTNIGGSLDTILNRLGGGNPLSQPPTRALRYNNQSQRPSVQHRNIGPYEININ